MKVNFDSLVNNLPEVVFCTDEKRNIIQVNQIMRDRLGRTHQELTSMKLDDLIPEVDKHAIMKHYIKVLNGIGSSMETKILINTNDYIDVELTSTYKETDNTVVDSDNLQAADTKSYVITVARDITSKKKLEEEIYDKNKELEKIAITDTLTGLYNRIYFDSFFEHEITKAKRYKRPLSIAKIDIDKFRVFNYMYGTKEGDSVLKRLGLLMRKSVRQNIDTVYRYSGGEFMIIFPETLLKDAQVVSDRLKESFSQITFEPAKISGETDSIHETISIGIVTLNEDDDNVSLLRRAEQALYNAKNSGGNSVFALTEKQEPPK